MYAAAPMPNAPAVGSLYIPGGVDAFGFYVLSPHTAMAEDPLTLSRSQSAQREAHTPAASPPSLAQEVQYWEQSFSTYLGLCAVADQLTALETPAETDAWRHHNASHTAAPSVSRRTETDNPLQHDPADTASTTSGSDKDSTDGAMPFTSSIGSHMQHGRLRVPVIDVVRAAAAAACTESTDGSPLSSFNASENTASLPAVIDTAPLRSSGEHAAPHMNAARAQLEALPLATVEAALDRVECAWEDHLWQYGGCAFGELRRLVWSFWSGASQRTAAAQEAADAQYAALVADDAEGDLHEAQPADCTPRKEPPSLSCCTAATGSGRSTCPCARSVAPLRREEEDTIARDLARTFPTHCLFTACPHTRLPPHLSPHATFAFSPSARAAMDASAGGPPLPSSASSSQREDPDTHTPPVTVAAGQTELNRVLRAYCRLDPEVGYCQGMSFVASLLLLHAPEAEAFQMFYCLLQNPVHSLRDLYAPHFGFLHTLLEALDRQVKQLLPVLHRHLHAEGVVVEYFASSWFLTLFATQLPLTLVVSLLDWFMLKGWAVMLQAAVAVLQWRQEDLLGMDMEAILLTLKGLKTSTAHHGLDTATPYAKRGSLLVGSPSMTSLSNAAEAHADTSLPSVEAPRVPLTGAASSLTSPLSQGHGATASASPAHTEKASAKDADWLAYLNEPATPAQAPAMKQTQLSALEVAETLRRVLQVPIDMDDVPSLW